MTIYFAFLLFYLQINLLVFGIYLNFRFIDWTHGVLSSVTDDVVDHFRLLGAIEALAAVSKVRFPFFKLLMSILCFSCDQISEKVLFFLYLCYPKA